MKKNLLTSLVFLGLSGCASITGSPDYGKPLNEKDVLNFAFSSSEATEVRNLSYILPLANEVYDFYNFEKDLFVGVSPEEIKRTLQVEIMKYLENQDALLLGKQYEKGDKRYVIKREVFDAREYDPVKKVYSLRISDIHRLPTLEFNSLYKKALTSNWPLRTIVTEEMLYRIFEVTLDFTNPQYDWNVEPDRAVEYSYKANKPEGSVEYIKKVVTFSGESPYIKKDYALVDLLNQVNDMRCTFHNRMYKTITLNLECEVTNNIAKAYIATDM